MASPQKENGHTPIANEIMEALAGVSLNGTQFRLLMVILRKTYGWSRKMDTIGLLDFCEATGLTKKVVSRELNRLVRRQIVLAWGDDHHRKQYGIQKDYASWLEDDPPEVSPKMGTPSVPQSVDTSRQSVPQSVDKVSPKQGTPIYKELKTSKARDTEPHGSGTLRDRTLAKYTAARDSGGNTIAVFGELFSNVLGSDPNWALLGRLSKELNNGGKLIDLIIEAGRQSISDDPNAYLAKMVKNYKAEVRPGRAGQADHNSAARNKVVI